METIANFVIKLNDLIEAQFAQFRNKAFSMLLAVGMLLAAGVFVIVGFIMIVWGIYLLFSQFMPLFLAAFTVALLAFITGGGLLLWAKRKML